MRLLLYSFTLGAILSANARAEPTTETALVENYATIAHATYSDALDAAGEMRQVIATFLDTPSEQALDAAKNSWIAARLPYLQTEVFRFYEGPIDDPENGLEPMINGWPMDEGYIDYVEGAPEAGIIYDTKSFPMLTKDLLARLNEKNGETYISTGYHAIEFLLWGQDLDENGPGARPFTDYTTEKQATRRGTYLKLVTDLLIEHLEGLVAEWAPDSANYRADFVANAADSTRQLIYGAKTFAGTELAGERLLVAWDTQAQEDEHSCFSDTTHLDVLYDAIGLHNVWFGTYGDIEGTGLRDLAVDLLGGEEAKAMATRIETIVADARTVAVPFDRAIAGERNSPERKHIFRLVERLEEFSSNLAAIEQAQLKKK